jgi:hypothetical protein
MSDLNTLKKIIPPDQAVANKALSRGLQQVKRIFDTDLPELAPQVATLETVDDLPLILALTEPVPASVTAFYANTFATGTGPGNTVTVDDVIGVAAGTTVTSQLPLVTDGLQQLTALGAFVPLTANGGSSGSTDNGIYTLMNYALTGAYSNAGNVQDITTIPNTNYYAGPQVFGNVDLAFGTAGTGLVAVANSYINNVAANSSYTNTIASINSSYSATVNQLAINVTNCVLAGIDIANVAFDIANANLISNATTTTMNFVSSLHDLGLDIAPGGTASFIERVSDQSNITGQAVIASMREGRNIQRLNQIGILLDTQIPAGAPVGNLG